MLDAFIILHRGGRILFAKDFLELEEEKLDLSTTTLSAKSQSQSIQPHQWPWLDTLVKDAFISAGSGFSFSGPSAQTTTDRQHLLASGDFIIGTTRADWLCCNSTNLIFIAAYQQSLGTLEYSAPLLALMKQLFTSSYKEDLSSTVWTEFQPSFEPMFVDALHELEESFRKQKKVQKSFQESRKAKKGNSSSFENLSTSKSIEQANQVITTLKAKSKAAAKSGKPRLDFSDEAESSTMSLDPTRSQELLGTGMGDFVASRYDTLELVSNHLTTVQKSSLFSYFSRAIRLSKPIELADLAPVMAKTKEHLMSKNVAADVASHICDSIASKLVGKSISAFSSLSGHIQSALEECLTAILTPKTSLDMLHDIKKCNSGSKPYSIVFVGVNGVGKSTNLSKVCFWLVCNGFKVLIAACDTFRSGAVEQLGVHVRNLQRLREGDSLELFNRGYGKDPAAIAKEALSYAQREKFDVVLIDTAGRMQDNEPLMRALAKVVYTNNPSKIVFVGEALVGNNASDQLSKFNRALVEHAIGSGLPRQIDGIILSKLDTVDDRVGAGLSMTFVTGAPILFVGVGQTYTDLRRLHVPSVVSMLIK